MLPEYTVPDDAVQETFPAPIRAKIMQSLFLVVVAILAVIYAGANGGAAIPEGLVVVLVCAWLTVCSLRMGVALTKVSVHVYGWVWFRRNIPRSAVVEVTDGALMPALRWKQNGRVRRTPLSAFYQGGFTPMSLNDQNSDLVQQLRETLLPKS
ncbi:MAG TPA: hypothetical protein VFH54_20465 [Mycobacteriales bacterium]|nr:hypothetical protein [Mycobacteriales bacterium]